MIQEQPTAPRFGMDEARAGPLETWNDLAWSDVGTAPGANVGVLATTPDGREPGRRRLGVQRRAHGRRAAPAAGADRDPRAAAPARGHRRNEDARPGRDARAARCPQSSLPIALLPVQVQTRYVTRAGKPQLLVRVYPDELHLDAHEPRLSAAEVAWGKKAWQLAWPATRDKDAERLAWTQLAERFGARRAEWIARKLRPTNLKDRPKTPPVFPAPGPLRTGDDPPPTSARHLPDRFVVARLPGRRARAARGGQADSRDASGRADVRRHAAAPSPLPAA